MSDRFTPTLGHIRTVYISHKKDCRDEPRTESMVHAEFDRAIEEVRAEARAQAFQAVRDNAEYEPEERDGPDMISPAMLYITVDKLNGLETSHDGVDWVRYTATDFCNEIDKAKAEALRQAADKFQSGDWFNVIEGNAHVKIGNGQRVTDWLRARAEKLASLLEEVRKDERYHVIQNIRDASEHEPDQIGDYGRVELEGYFSIGQRELEKIENGAGFDRMCMSQMDWESGWTEAGRSALQAAADEIERLNALGLIPSGQVTAEQRAEYWAFAEVEKAGWLRARAMNPGGVQ